MLTGRVIGDIVSTINHPFYDGKRMMIVEIVDEKLKAGNSYVIALDTVDAGPGDLVLIVDEGNSSRQIFEHTTAPVRSTIVGIIDEVTA